MRNLKQIYKINSPIEKVWEALTNAYIIEEWSFSPAIMKPKEETNFSLWEGTIYGKNLEVVENKKLVQEWFSGPWTKASIVSFELNDLKDVTEIILTQENIPDNEFEDIEAGWKSFYFDQIKKLLES
jgi:activator of HSP90 ATPase